MSALHAIRDSEPSAGREERLAYGARDVIAFPAGLPGFEACRGFVLVASSETAPVQRLDSVDGPEASFLVVDRRMLPPTYRYELGESDRARLGAEPASTLLWLALVMIEPDGAITANLRAPIVINPERMIGFQVMPQDCLFPLKHVLVPADAAEGGRQS